MCSSEQVRGVDFYRERFGEFKGIYWAIWAFVINQFVDNIRVNTLEAFLANLWKFYEDVLVFKVRRKSSAVKCQQYGGKCVLRNLLST